MFWSHIEPESILLTSPPMLCHALKVHPATAIKPHQKRFGSETHTPRWQRNTRFTIQKFYSVESNRLLCLSGTAAWKPSKGTREINGNHTFSTHHWWNREKIHENQAKSHIIKFLSMDFQPQSFTSSPFLKKKRLGGWLRKVTFHPFGEVRNERNLIVSLRFLSPRGKP